MSRQRLTIGTVGKIDHLASPNGRVVAHARYRDWDGKTLLVKDVGSRTPNSLDVRGLCEHSAEAAL